MSEILVDTGPLVAYLDRSDQGHAWAKQGQECRVSTSELGKTGAVLTNHQYSEVINHT